MIPTQLSYTEKKKSEYHKDEDMDRKAALSIPYSSGSQPS